MPTSSETTIVRVSTTVPLWGSSAPNALNSSLSAGRQRDAAEQPQHGADHPEQQAFVDDRLHDLPARAAERAQQPELARALGDGDREGVEDDERAHHERDVGEHQQEGAQEAEVVFQVGGVLGRLLCAGAHVDRVRAARRGCGRAARRRHAGLGGDVDLVEVAGQADDPLSLGRRQDRGARAAEGLAAAEPVMPTIV